MNIDLMNIINRDLMKKCFNIECPDEYLITMQITPKTSQVKLLPDQEETLRECVSNSLEKLNGIINSSESIRAFNRDLSYEDRRDYNYTSVVYAQRLLKENS